MLAMFGALDLSRPLNLLTGLIGLATLLAALIAFFRSGLAKATIETLKESNAALDERVRILEEQNRRLEVDLGAAHRTIEVLRDLATGANQMAQFQAQVVALIQQQTAEHGEILELLRASVRGA